jgi:hypothetical protein
MLRVTVCGSSFGNSLILLFQKLELSGGLS